MPFYEDALTGAEQEIVKSKQPDYKADLERLEKTLDDRNPKIPHTVGPWKLHIGDDYIHIGAPNGDSILGGDLHYPVDCEQSIADARLMTAGPIMLEALINSQIEIRATLESGQGNSTINRTMLLARLEANAAVIAKARG